MQRLQSLNFSDFQNWLSNNHFNLGSITMNQLQPFQSWHCCLHAYYLYWICNVCYSFGIKIWSVKVKVVQSSLYETFAFSLKFKNCKISHFLSFQKLNQNSLGLEIQYAKWLILLYWIILHILKSIAQKIMIIVCWYECLAKTFALFLLE